MSPQHVSDLCRGDRRRDRAHVQPGDRDGPRRKLDLFAGTDPFVRADTVDLDRRDGAGDLLDDPEERRRSSPYSLLVDVVSAVNQAEITLDTVVAVRDKVVQAYQSIMNMPI